MMQHSPKQFIQCNSQAQEFNILPTYEKGSSTTMNHMLSLKQNSTQRYSHVQLNIFFLS